MLLIEPALLVTGYHGTAIRPGEVRTCFDLCPPARATHTAGQVVGIFFARHRHAAECYAECAVLSGVGKMPWLMEVELSIKSPFNTTVDDFYEATENRFDDEIEAYREQLISLGHDAVFVGDDGDIVVFDPAQIRIISQAALERRPARRHAPR